MIAFDLDGTLINSSRDLAESASDLVQSYGAAPLSEPEVQAMVGDGASVLVARALASRQLPVDTPGALARFLDIYDGRLLNNTVPYDGVAEVLALLLETGPLAVLTNKPLAPALRILEHLGLRGFFVEVIGGDSRFGRKPHPAGLQSLMRAGDVTVMVGDSPVDAQAAEAAGCGFVLAGYGPGAAKFSTPLPASMRVAHHARELAWLADTRTFDAARVPIVNR